MTAGKVESRNGSGGAAANAPDDRAPAEAPPHGPLSTGGWARTSLEASGICECVRGAASQMPPSLSEANADDRFSGSSRGRVEGGDGVVKRRDRADVGA